MKKALLFLLIMINTQIMMAQQRATLPNHLKDLSVSTEFTRPALANPDLPVFNAPNSFTRNITGGIEITEDVVGTTYYDLQSNSLLQNRIWRHDDGTIGAAWTLGMNATAFADRGTGYNFFDGTSWGPHPAQRIETVRTGWPSYAPWGAGGEIVVSHDFSSFLLQFNTRPVKGTGSWTQFPFTYTTGPTTLAWPRMITSGEDHEIVHLLACTYGEYQGQAVGMVYSRSLDGGVTWDIQNEMIDGTGADFYTEINADQYVWANPVGSTIAFLVAGAWHDMFMMKSDDNGETWEKTVIWEHPYPFFDWETTLTDTFFCVDNSASIALDSEGKAHVVFGISRVIHASAGTGYNYYPYVDGIGYWNEDMPVFSNNLNALSPPQYGYPATELTEDYNYIGYTQDVDGDGEITFIETATGFPMSYRELGVSTMPTVAVGPNGYVVVIFTSTTETYDNSLWNYKKLWMRENPYGLGWGDFHHLTADIFHIFDESIYPVAYPAWDDYVHVLYNNDGSPGTALDGDHDYIENRITYMKIGLYVGIDEKQPANAILSGMEIMPNPANERVWVNYTLNRSSNVTLSIADLSGRVSYQQDLGHKNPGEYTQQVALTGLRPGLYFVQLKSGNQSVNGKLIIQ